MPVYLVQAKTPGYCMKIHKVEILAITLIKILTRAAKRTFGSNCVTPKGEFSGLFN